MTEERLQSAWEQVLPPTIFLLVLLICWEGAVRWLTIPKWLLPAPSAIFERFSRCGTCGTTPG